MSQNWPSVGDAVVSKLSRTLGYPLDTGGVSIQGGVKGVVFDQEGIYLRIVLVDNRECKIPWYLSYEMFDTL